MAEKSNAGAAGKRDSFGCATSALDDDRTINSSSLTFHRKRAVNGGPGQVTMAAGRGYLLGLSVEGGHRRRIFHGHHSTAHDFTPSSIYLRNLGDPYKADLSGEFDFTLIEIGQSALAELADGADMPGINELSEITAEADPVLGNLAKALFSSAHDERERSSMFIDQISIAMGVHILRKYGNGRARPTDRRCRLSRSSEARAKEIILSRLAASISIDDVATACNLSRGHFTKAFREATGKTPHQWLIEQRIERACSMMLTPGLTLAEISVACGFADQSHLTRAFSVSTGTTPGAWRRQMLS